MSSSLIYYNRSFDSPSLTCDPGIFVRYFITDARTIRLSLSLSLEKDVEGETVSDNDGRLSRDLSNVGLSNVSYTRKRKEGCDDAR